MAQHSRKRRYRGVSSLSYSMASLSLSPAVQQEPAVPASFDNVPRAIVAIACTHELASAMVPRSNVPFITPSVPQEPVVPASANDPSAIVPDPAHRFGAVALVPATTIADTDVDHLGDAFEALSLLDGDADLAPIFATLTTFDAYDEDAFMRPPVDVPHQEPLWLAAIHLSDLMDIIDDMDLTFTPLPSPLLSPLLFAPGAPVDELYDPIPMYLYPASPLIPRLPAPCILHLCHMIMPILNATPFIHSVRSTTTTPMPSPENFMPPPSSPCPQASTNTSASSSPSLSPSPSHQPSPQSLTRSLITSTPSLSLSSGASPLLYAFFFSTPQQPQQQRGQDVHMDEEEEEEQQEGGRRVRRRRDRPIEQRRRDNRMRQERRARNHAHELHRERMRYQTNMVASLLGRYLQQPQHHQQQQQQLDFEFRFISASFRNMVIRLGIQNHRQAIVNLAFSLMRASDLPPQVNLVRVVHLLLSLVEERFGVLAGMVGDDAANDHHHPPVDLDNDIGWQRLCTTVHNVVFCNCLWIRYLET